MGIFPILYVHSPWHWQEQLSLRTWHMKCRALRSACVIDLHYALNNTTMAGAQAMQLSETLLEVSLLESSFVSHSEGWPSNEPYVRPPRELSAYQSTAWRRQMHVRNDQFLAQSRRARGSSGEPCCLFGLHALLDEVLSAHASRSHLQSACGLRSALLAFRSSCRCRIAVSMGTFVTPQNRFHLISPLLFKAFHGLANS